MRKRLYLYKKTSQVNTIYIWIRLLKHYDKGKINFNKTLFQTFITRSQKNVRHFAFATVWIGYFVHICALKYFYLLAYLFQGLYNYCLCYIFFSLTGANLGIQRLYQMCLRRAFVRFHLFTTHGIKCKMVTFVITYHMLLIKQYQKWTQTCTVVMQLWLNNRGWYIHALGSCLWMLFSYDVAGWDVGYDVLLLFNGRTESHSPYFLREGMHQQ